MNYYITYGKRYAMATAEMKRAARTHWIRVHAENLKTGRQDLIIFSGQILAQMDMVDANRLNAITA